MRDHDIPSKLLLRRYEQSLENLAEALKFMPEAHVFDNSSNAEPFRLVLTTSQGAIRYAAKPQPAWLVPVVAAL
jgi:predicted ABC-type ATPase